MRLLDLGWPGLILGLVAFAVVSIGGLGIVGAILVRLPHDYFTATGPRRFWANSHPVVRGLGLAVKNLTGALLAVLGVVLAMPGVPGPGLLMILLGVMLLDFPGKRRLECWLIGRPKVLLTVNRLRSRWGKPPLVVERRLE